MNISDEIKKIKQDLKRINELLMQLDQVAGEHNLLSTQHPDTDPDDPIAGDMIIADATPAWARLPKGNDGDVLQLSAGLPIWDDPPLGANHDLLSSSHDDTTPDTVEKGDLITGQGSGPASWERLPVGDPGQILQTDGEDVYWDDNPGAAHDLLSAIHPDSTPAAVQRGDIIVGIGSSPKWERLAKGNASQVLTMGANEPAWADPGAAGSTHTFYDPDRLQDTPSALDDHFDDDAILESGSIWTGFQLGAKITQTEADHHLIHYRESESATKWRGIFQPIPDWAGDFTIACKFSMIGRHQDEHSFGIALFEDAANNPDTCDMIVHLVNWTGGWLYHPIIGRWNQWDNFNGNYFDWTPNHIWHSGPHYLRIRKYGDDLYYDFSLDGVGWWQLYTHSHPFDCAEFGLVSACAASGGPYYVYFYVDWFKYLDHNHRQPMGGLCKHTLS